MNPFDKLKSIFDIKIEKLFEKLNILSNNSISNTHYHIHLDGGFSGTVSQEGKTLKINPDHISPGQKSQLQNLIKNELFQDCDYLLTNTDENMLEMAQEIIDREIKKFSVLEGLIPRDDFYALKASLVVRELHSQGKPVEEYKDNIFKTVGERGRKICNICTAGYFDGILDLYNACKTETGINRDDFLSRYNIIISESAFSVFVHAWKEKDALKKSILEKLATNKRYGNYYVNIHALNKANIKTAEEAVREIITENQPIEISEFSKSRDALFVRLEEVKS